VKSVQKRRAIEEALTPFIQGKALAHALFLWDEKYAEQRNFALQHFLRELCETTALAPLRSRMLQALIQALSKLQDEMISEAQQNTAAKRKSWTLKKQSSTNPELAMFMSFVDSLIEHAGGELAMRIRLFVLDNLDSTTIATQLRWDLHAWLSQMTPLTETRLDIKSMQQVINLAYVALCEYLGPIKADAILQNTVSRVQRAYPALSVQRLL